MKMSDHLSGTLAAKMTAAIGLLAKVLHTIKR